MVSKKAVFLGLIIFSVSFTEANNSFHVNDFLKMPFMPIKQLIFRLFGGWSIDKELFDYIRSILSDGKTLLELGSGWTSSKFSEYYEVYSVEHNSFWLGQYNTHYIYAPIINGWYDVVALEKNLPQKYDLILVDGPTGDIGRGGFFTNLHLFDTNVPIIFDDVNRKAEHELMVLVAKKLNRTYRIISSSSKKSFGIVLPEVV